MNGDSLIGTTIDKKYTITGFVGEGGMGKVYKGVQVFLDKEVAIKILNLENAENQDEAIARFYREARLAAKLNHPNSITIYDFGEIEDGSLYMVMEFLHGQSLDTILSAGNFLGFQRITSYIRQILLALESAHQIGLVHRDLKPENIFVDKTLSGYEHITVLDFGIAKKIDNQSHSITRPGMVWGTPEYMSPEQAGGKELDGRTDIYSLGVMFYEMLTGQRPFEDDNPVEVMLAQIHEQPKHSFELAPERNIPMSLDAIVLWAMEKDREKRIQSASEFRKILESWMTVLSESSEVEEFHCPVCNANIPKNVKKCPVCLHNIKIDENANLTPDSEQKSILHLRQQEIKQHNKTTTAINSSLSELKFGGTTRLRSLVSPDKKKLTKLYGREKLIAELKKAIDNKEKIVIRGQAGVGRHYFIKYFFKTYNNKTDKPIFFDFRYAQNRGVVEIYKILLDYYFSVLNIEISTNTNIDFLNEFQNKIIKSIILRINPPIILPNKAIIYLNIILKTILNKVLKIESHIPIIDCPLSNTNLWKKFIFSISEVYSYFKIPFVIISEHFEQNDLSNYIFFEIKPFSSRYIYEMATDILGREPDEKLMDFIFITKGYPFYINQLIDLYLEDELSESIRIPSDIINYRLNRLPTGMREILQILALSDRGLNQNEIAAILENSFNLDLSVELLLNKGIIVKQEENLEFNHIIWKNSILGLIPIEVKKDFCKHFLQENLLGNMEISYVQLIDYALETEDFSFMFAGAKYLAQNSLNWGFSNLALFYYHKIWRYIINRNLLDTDIVDTAIQLLAEMMEILASEEGVASSIAFLEELINHTVNPKIRTKIKLILSEYYLKNYDFLKAEEVFIDYETSLFINNLPVSEKAFLIFLKIKMNTSPDFIETLISNYLEYSNKKELFPEFFTEVANFYLSGGDHEAAYFWSNITVLNSFQNKTSVLEVEKQNYIIKLSSGNLNIARLHLYSMLTEYNKLSDYRGIADTYIKMAQLEFQMNQFKISLYHLQKVISISKQIDWQEGVNISEILIQSVNKNYITK